MPELDIPRENIVFISGIGCAARFPYYMETYGFHSIHGRAPAIASGLAVARPELDVWVVTGDGDALSIGGNHLIHAMRRNVNLTILMFNNQIYGLTKGQYSPTSEIGKVTKSTPFGSTDYPFNPVSLALGAECTFVARTIDNDRKHFTEILRKAAAAPRHDVHRGLPELQHLQRRRVRRRARRAHRDAANRIYLEHGKPIRFGANGEKGVVTDTRRHAAHRRRRRGRRGAAARPRRDGARRGARVRAQPPVALADRPDADRCVPRGRASGLRGPRHAADRAGAGERSGPGDLAALLRSGETWDVS